MHIFYRLVVKINILDLVALAGIVALTLVLWLFSEQYRQLNFNHPLLLGFIIFGILSTFGEGLSQRVAGRGWRLKHVMLRILLWGGIGIWISLAFPFLGGGTNTLISAGLWPAMWPSFSISLWANILSGFAFWMMMFQFWGSTIIEHGWTPPWRIFEHPEFPGWAKTVLLTLLFFWLPAHSVTFMLPPTWQTIFAAYLGIALGFVLSRRRMPAQMRSSPSHSFDDSSTIHLS